MTDFTCSAEPPPCPGFPKVEPRCSGVHSMRSLNVAQSGGELSGSLTPNVNFVPTGFVDFAFTGSVAPVGHPGTVRFTTGDQPIAALQNETLSYSFEGQTNESGTTMTGTLRQERKHRPIMNPSRSCICGSTDPVVTCPSDIRTSTSTLTR